MLLFGTHLLREDGIVDGTIEALGYILVTFAVIGRVWAAAYISGNKNKRLVTAGPYSLCRNPLYLFSFLGTVGLGMATESITVVLILIILFIVISIPTIRSEEQSLHVIFGDEYTKYMQRVPRFWPKFSAFWRPDSVQINPAAYAKALKHGVTLMLFFGILQAAEWAHAHHLLPNLFTFP